jgi:hypothetical protein
LKSIFVAFFLVGVAFLYFYIYGLISQSFRKHWRFRIQRWKPSTKQHALWDRWILQSKHLPRNEQMRILLRRAGFRSQRHYILYKKGELLFPIASLVLLFISWILPKLANGQTVESNDYVWMAAIAGTCRFSWPWLLHWRAKQRAHLIGAEIVRFSDRLLMTLSTKTPLYYSIKSAGRTTKALKPYINDLLMEWVHSHPRQAIERFTARVAVDEIIPLGNAMLVILDHPSQAIYLMEQQMKNVEVIRDFVTKQRIRAKPVYLILLVTIPFTAGMVALIAPWYSETIRQLEMIF